MLTDIEEPVAFDRTPLTAAVAGAVGPRTPFSPERTFVTLPRGNAEIEPLAGAFEKQGATKLLNMSQHWFTESTMLSHDHTHAFVILGNFRHQHWINNETEW